MLAPQRVKERVGVCQSYIHPVDSTDVTDTDDPERRAIVDSQVVAVS